MKTVKKITKKYSLNQLLVHQNKTSFIQYIKSVCEAHSLVLNLAINSIF